MPEDLEATMPDATSIMHPLPVTVRDMADIIPVTVQDMADTTPVTVQDMADTALVMEVDTADMVHPEDNSYNTYFIDNPLIIGG